MDKRMVKTIFERLFKRMVKIFYMNISKILKKTVRGKSVRHKKWNMSKVKRIINCPNCGANAMS
jgi:hypothetical protein